MKCQLYPPMLARHHPQVYKTGLFWGFPYLKWVAAFVWFVCELHLTHLAHVAVDVEVLLHGHHPHGLLGPFHRGDAVPTGGALRGKDPVEVVDAVDLVVEVHRERNSV